MARATKSKFAGSLNTEKEFEGEDIPAGSSSGNTSSSSSGRQQQRHWKNALAVPENTFRNHLLLMSLLEHLCSFYVTEPHKKEQLFKVLVKQFSSMKIMSPMTSIDELSTVRSQYKRSFDKLVFTALSVINKEMPLQFPTTMQERTQLFLQPRINYLHKKMLGLTTADCVGMQTSRYREEYFELGTLGRGAYGSVFKARNKLDGTVYAIKKVAFQEPEPEFWFKILREVKNLACLTHKNVIRYHGAWLEYENPVQSVLSGAANGLPAIAYEGDSQSVLNKASHLPPFNSAIDDSGDSVVFRDFSGPVNELSGPSSHGAVVPVNRPRDFGGYSPMVFGMEASGCASKSVTFADDVEGPQLDDDSFSALPNETEIVNRSYVVLHIQMELCLYTLKEWLTDRNMHSAPTGASCTRVELCEEESSKLLKQILKGVDYIHSYGFMHRDLKPKNIFLMPDGSGGHEVKIGDFGLARQRSMTSTDSPSSPMTPCPGRRECVDPDSEEDMLTSGVGTTIYAAPEQLKGSLYNEKSDMYSVGLMMFEMYHPFGTEMERIHTLNDFRKGSIPEDFLTKCPVQAHYAKQLTHHNPDLRPTSREVLDSEIFCTKDHIISNLRTDRQRDRDRIADLEKQLLELQRENERLEATQQQLSGTRVHLVCSRCESVEEVGQS